MLNGRELTPTPTPLVGKLDSLRGVRRELTKVYRDMRQGKLDTQDGTRLAFVLNVIAKLIETSDLEARIEALEKQQQMRDRQQ
jgi:hypothetical protein